MKQESLKHIADGAMISAVGSGTSSYFDWFAFINTNASGVGVILSFIFGVAGIIFYILTWKKQTLADENKRAIEANERKLDDHIEETRLGLGQIISLLNGVDKE